MALDNVTVARRYSNALFQVALQEKQVEEVHADLMALKQVLKDEPRLVVLVTSPQVKLSAKRDLLNDLTSGASKITDNLVRMLFDYGRFGNLEDIINEFNKLYDAHNGIVRATVTTAVPLNSDQEAKLADKFAQVTGAKKVELNKKVDTSIIGGVILQSQSKIYDGSVKTNIESIKRLLIQ